VSDQWSDPNYKGNAPYTDGYHGPRFCPSKKAAHKCQRGEVEPHQQHVCVCGEAWK
jgi:hypothetical protein